MSEGRARFACAEGVGGVFKRAGLPTLTRSSLPMLVAAGNPVDDDALAATMETEIQSPHNHWPRGGVGERRESSDPLIGRLARNLSPGVSLG